VIAVGQESNHRLGVIRLVFDICENQHSKPLLGLGG